jgi:hypothetical protein
MTEPRKPLTKREFGLLIIKQNCLCGCGCGRKLDFSAPKLVTDEHRTALFSGGTNELENRSLWLTECSILKTSRELPAMAKVRRIEGGKTQADRRAKAKAEGGYRKMGARGFDKSWRRKLDGTTERRT